MDRDSKVILIVGALIAVVIIGLFAYSAKTNQLPGELDGFESCLKEKGATFYGAFWCPHCQAQKKLFGRSVKNVPYVECSTPNGQSQMAICIENNIESYPTWVFADGSRTTGEQTLSTLAEKTGCVLPVTTE
jgi:thiol-disulfide isomerase/thioredoxin